MKRRIYIAAKFSAQERLQGIRHIIQTNGWGTVVGTWLSQDGDDTGTAAGTEHAKRDLDEVEIADTLILDTLDENPRGGREIECGYFMAFRKFLPEREVWLVGPQRNVFHSLADREFIGWDGALRVLRDGA